MKRINIHWLDIGFWLGITMGGLSGLSVLFVFGSSGHQLDTTNWLDYPLILLALLFRWSPGLFLLGMMLVVVFGISRKRAG